MLTPRYMEKLPDEILNMYSKIEDDILRDIGQRISRAEEVTGTARVQIESLLLANYDLKEIEEAIADITDKSTIEVKQLIHKAGLDAYNNDLEIYKKANKNLPNINDNLNILNYIKAAASQAEDDISNITNSIGLAGKPLKEFYDRELSKAVFQVQAGAIDRESAIRNTVNSLASKGLEVIDYQNGRNYQLESAVRMNVNSTVNRLSATISLQNAEDMEQDLMEITSHAGARPSHAEWQGEIVSLSGNPKYLSLRDIEYGDVVGFMGVNCRHNWYPYFEGVSLPNWMKEELEYIDNPPFEYEERVYTHYEATQKQRALERSMRQEKRKIIVYESAGESKLLQAHSTRYNRYRTEYAEFSKAANLREKMERTYIHQSG